MEIFDKTLSKKPDRRELFNYIFDMLEYLDLVKWTHMYNRESILEAYIQIDIKPYEYMGKTQRAVIQGIGRVFNNTKVFSNKPKSKQWINYLLWLIDYKYCYKCKQTKHISEFTNNISNTNGKEKRCKSCAKGYKEDNKEILDKYSKNYREENKEKISKHATDRRWRITLHIINVMVREGKLPECSICGYKENWAALEFHHIDSKLERPEWTYDKKGNKKTPSQYILYCKDEEQAEERYLLEMDNLELLCANCHREHHHNKWEMTKILMEVNNE